MKLFYNEATKVVFGSDADQPEGIREISNIAIPDLIANGATVDPSANDVPNASVSTGGIESESTENATSAEAPNALASDAVSESAPSTAVSAPVASGASVVAASPDDLAALHPGTTPEVSYSATPGAGTQEKDASMLADSTAIVGAGNMHLNSNVTDATGTTGTVEGRPVLSNATAGYTATLTPGVTDTGETSDHPAQGLLTRLWKSLEGNSMANEARDLILKIRATL